MEKEYWIKRWENNDTSFDQAEPHRYLKKYFNIILPDLKSTIFFPLCGKSVDMRWALEQGSNVFGVEVSEIPIKDFFIHNDIHYSKKTIEKFSIYFSDNCQIMQGDIFDLEKHDISTVNAIYDRGCFVALPIKNFRDQYIKWLKAVTPYGCKILMILFDFEQDDEVLLPPFPVSNHTLNQLLGDAFTMELLEEELVEPKEKWAKRGIRNLKESAVLLTRNATSL